MIREAIVKLVNKENLTYEMAEGAMDEIMGGKADPIQISAFLTAMTMKGETIEASDQKIKNGYVLVLVDGYPLGWAKNTNGTLKNKYLSGWRMMS